MATEKIVTTGVVKGNTIVLDEPAPLSEGAWVTVTMEEMGEEEKERIFVERLAARGIMVTIPKTPPEQIRRNKPIDVKGKPLSQVIIEERR